MRQQFRSRGFTGGAQVEMQLEGQWAETNRLVRDLPLLIAAGYERGSKKAAKKFYNEIRKNIRDGGSRFGFVPLAPSTLLRKAKAGGDLGMFTFYHYYYRSIEMFENGGTWYVGVRKGARNPKTATKGSSYTIAQYAAVLENGSSKIPARPLWKMTFREMGGIKAFRKIIVAAIAYECYKRHGFKPTLY